MTNNHVKDISRIYLEQIVESSHLETDMKKRVEDNEKAREDIKKTKAHKEMAAVAAKKFDEEVEQIDEISADLALSASKKAGQVAGVLAGLSAGDPKVKAKAVKKRKQSERLYAKQAKKRVEMINPIKEDEDIEEEKKAKVKRWWDDDGDGKGYEEGEVSGKFKKKKVKEALDPVGKEDDDIDNDGDVDKSDSYLKNRRKVRGKFIAKEGYSNWRQDLIEIMNDEEGEKPIKEKKIRNKIKTSATDGGLKIGEAVEQLGGQLIEMIELNGILDEISDEELLFISDSMIEESVREVFCDYLQEGYEIEEIEDLICESIDTSFMLLNEAEGNSNNEKRTGILQKIKGAVKSVGKGLARGAGYVAGAAVRGVKAVGREAAAGYQRGRQGSSASTSTSTSSASHEDDDKDEKKPSILSRIGSKLKRGLAKAARAVSRGARNVARKMEGGETKKVEAPKVAPKKAEKPEDPWAGSATTPAKPKAKTKKAAAPKAKAPAAAKPKTKRKSKLDDLLASVRSESVVGDRARNAVADQRLDDAQGETQSSVDKLKKGPKSVTRASASIAAKKSEKTARGMHPKPKTGAYRVEETQLDEKTLTDSEKAKKEEIFKSLKSKRKDFESRYPGRGEEVMHGVATKMAKKLA